MKLIKNKNYRKIAIVISIPILFIAQYYLFKFGVLKPMVKGVEIQIVDGDYIKDIDKYIVKLGDTVTLSMGDYRKIPGYAKEADIKFRVLDDTGTLSIDGDNKSTEMSALKEGYSSIGIMKGTRVLKKVTILVVNPKVESLDINIDGDLAYVGDTAKVESTLEVDYKRFQDKYKVAYESSNENILKIEGDEIRAVGVGTATIYAKSQDKIDSLRYKISAKVSKINIGDTVEIEVGQNKKLNPEIVTSPVGLKHPKIEYKLLGSKLPMEMAIRVDEDGTVVGLREGQDQVMISCGSKSNRKTKIVTINVVKESITNKNIENLAVDYEILDNKMIVKLTWDYLKDVYNYDIYMKNNYLQEKEFNIVKSVIVKEEEILGTGKVQATLEIDLTKIPYIDLEFYVKGNTDVGETKQSNIASVKIEDDNTGNNKIQNLSGHVDKDNNRIKLTWDAVNSPDYTYNVYVRDNIKGETDFRLYKEGLITTECIIDILQGEVNLDVYVAAINNSQEVIKSDLKNFR